MNPIRFSLIFEPGYPHYFLAFLRNLRDKAKKQPLFLNVFEILQNNGSFEFRISKIGLSPDPRILRFIDIWKYDDIWIYVVDSNIRNNLTTFARLPPLRNLTQCLTEGWPIRRPPPPTQTTRWNTASSDRPTPPRTSQISAQKWNHASNYLSSITRWAERVVPISPETWVKVGGYKTDIRCGYSTKYSKKF